MSTCTHLVRCFDEIILLKHLKNWKEFRLALDEYEKKTFTNFGVRDFKKCADLKVCYLYVDFICTYGTKPHPSGKKYSPSKVNFYYYSLVSYKFTDRKAGFRVS